MTSRRVCFLFLSVSLIVLCCCNAAQAASNDTEPCTGMFSEGLLSADSRTMVATSFATDLEPYKAVVNTSKAWCAGNLDVYQFLQVNLGKVRTLSSLSVQGYKPSFVAYLKKFTLTYTADDVNWNYYKDPDDTDPKVFVNSPSDEDDIVHHPLNSLSALRIRIGPEDWEMYICARIEIYTCDPVNGTFSEWSEWGPCLNRNQHRLRSCDSPAPARGGMDCVGGAAQSQSCFSGNSTTTSTINVPLVTPTSGSNISCIEGSSNCTKTLLHDPCSPNPCGDNTLGCVALGTGSNATYTCNCTQGYRGQNCTDPAIILYGQWVPNEEMHSLQQVTLPVAAGVGTSAVVTTTVGLVYFIAKRRLAKIAPRLLEV